MSEQSTCARCGQPEPPALPHEPLYCCLVLRDRLVACSRAQQATEARIVEAETEREAWRQRGLHEFAKWREVCDEWDKLKLLIEHYRQTVDELRAQQTAAIAALERVELEGGEELARLRKIEAAALTLRNSAEFDGPEYDALMELLGQGVQDG